MAAFMDEHAASYYHALSAPQYCNDWNGFGGTNSPTVNSMNHNGELQHTAQHALPYQQQGDANLFSGFNLNPFKNAHQQYPPVLGEGYAGSLQNVGYPQQQQHDFTHYPTAQQQQYNYGPTAPANFPVPADLADEQQRSYTEMTVRRAAQEESRVASVEQRAEENWDQYAVPDLPLMERVDDYVLPSEEDTFFNHPESPQYEQTNDAAMPVEVVGGTSSGNTASAKTRASRYANSRGRIKIALKGLFQQYCDASIPLPPTRKIRRTSPRVPRQQQRRQSPANTGTTEDGNEMTIETSIYVKDLVSRLIEEMLAGKTTQTPLSDGGSPSGGNHSETLGDGPGSSASGRGGSGGRSRGNVKDETAQPMPEPQPYVLGCASSNSGRGQRDTDGSSITLKMLLETPYSPRGKSTRNKELEEYQRILAEDAVEKKINELRAKDREMQRKENASIYNASDRDANIL